MKIKINKELILEADRISGPLRRPIQMSQKSKESSPDYVKLSNYENNKRTEARNELAGKIKGMRIKRDELRKQGRDAGANGVNNSAISMSAMDGHNVFKERLKKLHEAGDTEGMDKFSQASQSNPRMIKPFSASNHNLMQTRQARGIDPKVTADMGRNGENKHRQTFLNTAMQSQIGNVILNK